MRLIGHLASEAPARVFADFLYVQGIENQLEMQDGDGWGIWINDEDKIESAAEMLKAFQENSTDPKYRTKAKTAGALRAEKDKSEAEYRKKLLDRRHLFRPLAAYGFGPLTFVLIVICVGVFILSRLSPDANLWVNLFITDPTGGGSYARGSMLEEIRHGQVWRLVTPIFIHFSVLHILFNMLWLRDLGSMIEGRQSSRHLAILVLGVAVVSNLAQFYFSGPNFGGMSGVVYGLLGYIWMRGKYDPGSGLFLHPTTVTMMLIWLVACYTGLLGQVANTAHAAGLVMGVVWGYLSSRRYR